MYMKSHSGSVLKRIAAQLLVIFSLLIALSAAAQTSAVRERILLNDNWRFALGNAIDPSKDFNHGTGYFSYLAKTGFGDGPASPAFDDRAWRVLNVPHDWAVEMPFDATASKSHGYKTVGPNFPQNSIGWYRRELSIPASDLGRRIRIEFDGVQRQSQVFINGFFVGEEDYGNLSFSYDITPYLNYGGKNVIVVRADVSFEAGWYYEGAGINRAVYLLKTTPVHIDQYGTAVVTELADSKAVIAINTSLINEHENSAYADVPAEHLLLSQMLLDASGEVVAQTKKRKTTLATGATQNLQDQLKLKYPILWSLDNPYLYKLVTRLENRAGQLLDEYETPVGVRTIRFDADEGFFLNGEHIKLKGSNNHEDHAGVGAAIPDALMAYRLQRLKDLGMNAYRASHAPPSPAMLNLADRMGILVIDENRLMGINDVHLSAVERMIKRDRNHPSIILWSLGNEEWGIEGNIKGARITKKMQSFARSLDPSRLNTVANSGGWGGISAEIGVAGINYINQAKPDQQHLEYPQQILLGTEETTTQQTRGVYVENKALGHLAPAKDGTAGANAAVGWQYYAARPYLAGIFYWTGFDYRGEPTPYVYPAVGSQFGILDSCGFAKDGAYYLQAWWAHKPVLHIYPHWNWPGREGELIDVVVFSNSDDVELFLNNKSLGKKVMPRNGQLSWTVAYAPGELRAQGFSKNELIQSARVVTTTQAAAIQLTPHVNSIVADARDLAVINLAITDAQGSVVPTADNQIHFSVAGPGKIIGVGNGNPSSHENDVELERIRTQNLGEWTAPNPADSKTPVKFEVTFDRPTLGSGAAIHLLLNALGKMQTATLNGKPLYKDKGPEQARTEILLAPLSLKERDNVLRLDAAPFDEWRDREGLFQFHPATLKVVQAAAPYKRKVFNGLAQVIVQSTGGQGEITLKATAEGLAPAEASVMAQTK